MDNFFWSAAGLLLFMSIDTGGGGHVGGDAKTGRDFTGRDNDEQHITFNNYVEQKRRRRDDSDRLPGTLEETVEWQQLAIFGSPQLGVTGLRDQIREQEREIAQALNELRTELLFMRILGVALGLIVFTLVAVNLVLYWPGS